MPIFDMMITDGILIDVSNFSGTSRYEFDGSFHTFVFGLFFFSSAHLLLVTGANPYVAGRKISARELHTTNDLVANGHFLRKK